jgi:hypothetical protein
MNIFHSHHFHILNSLAGDPLSNFSFMPVQEEYEVLFEKLLRLFEEPFEEE